MSLAPLSRDATPPVTRFAVYIFGDAKGQKFTDYIKVSTEYRNPGERAGAAAGAAAAQRRPLHTPLPA